MPYPDPARESGEVFLIGTATPVNGAVPKQ